MTTKKTDPAPVRVPGMPSPGQKRLWKISHYPHNSKTPLLLELYERVYESGALKRLIGKAHTIADPEAIVDTANGILERSGRVDEFIGIIDEEEK